MTMKIKCNSVAGYKAGEIVEVAESNGIPKSLFWRRRLRDAERDECCEIVKSEKPNKKATAKATPKTTEDLSDDNNK